MERRLHRLMPEVLKLAIEFRGLGFRNVGQRFANKLDILSTTGSYKWGGRFNVATDFGVLYLSCDVHTCIEELQYAAKYEGVAIDEKLPRTIVGIRVELKKVLDLTDASVRRRLRISRKVLVETDWAKDNLRGREASTQIIGRAAKAAGFEGLLVPSARWPGKNLNLIDDGGLLLRATVTNIKFLETKRRRKRRP